MLFLIQWNVFWQLSDDWISTVLPVFHVVQARWLKFGWGRSRLYLTFVKNSYHDLPNRNNNCRYMFLTWKSVCTWKESEFQNNRWRWRLSELIMNNSVKQTEFAQRTTDLCRIFKGAVLGLLVVNEYLELFSSVQCLIAWLSWQCLIALYRSCNSIGLVQSRSGCFMFDKKTECHTMRVKIYWISQRKFRTI